jgi:hypothetical protein
MQISDIRALGLLAVVSCWPFASFVEQNLRQLTLSDVGVVAALWAALLAAACALAWALARMFRMPMLFSAVPVAGAAVLFMLCGAVLDETHSAAAYIVLIAVVVAALAYAVRREALRRPLIVFALVASLSPLALLAVHLAKHYPGDEPQAAPHPVWAQPVKIRPNVLHVIVDGYAHSKTLAALAGLDNSGFERELAQRGFVVVEKAASNYPTTYLSLAGTLNMDYVALPETPYADRRKFYLVIGGAGSAVAGFRSAGYSYLHSGSGWGAAWCSGREDLCLNRDNELRDRLGEAGFKVVRMTPLRAWAGGEEVLAKRGGIESIQQSLGSMYLRQPFYAFAHSLPPHPPYFVRADCAERKPVGALHDWADPGAYRETVLCLNRKLVQLVDAVLSRDAEAMIVLQADHGSGFNARMFTVPIDQWTKPMVEERFRTFLAIRAPSSCRQWIRDDLTGVNVLRFVAGCLQQRTPDYLPNRFFAAAYDSSEEFGKVAELRQPPW